MSGDQDFNPRLGRIGNLGSRLAATYLRKASKKLARARATGAPKFRRSGFTGKNTGRGSGAGAMAKHWSNGKSRRVIVKVHIARATSLGNQGFGKHINYIKRDGVDHDGEPGRIYDRSENDVDGKSFIDRGNEDRRQFRLIVSPEDAHQIEDLNAYTREFMATVERDLGKQLDWVAVNHHDTAQPHIHIAIRGDNQRNGELIIAKSYITHGFRHRAEEIVTRELGQRRLKEIARARHADIAKNRWTSIDQDIEKRMERGVFKTERAHQRFDHFDEALKRKRLNHLKSLGLAEFTGPAQWHLKQGWQETLKELGRQGDMIRTLSRQLGQRFDPSLMRSFTPDHAQGGEVIGRLSALIAGDEIRNGRIAVIEGLDGHQWTLPISEKELIHLPKLGGVASVRSRAAELKSGDRTIMAIAQVNGGKYSEALHERMDPTSSAAFRLAHKRRLESLRRGGVAARHSDGTWTIPQDYEARILKFESQRNGVALEVKSWLPVDKLIERRAYGWVDQLDSDDLERLGIGFGAEVRAAKITRQLWLREQGLLHAGELSLSTSAIDRLEVGEKSIALNKQAKLAGLEPLTLSSSGRFSGTYTKNVTLAQGRFAVVQSDKQLALVKWQAHAAAWKGRNVTLTANKRGAQWELSRTRTLGR